MSWTVEKKEYTHWTLAMKCNLCTVCLDCFPFLWHFNNHLKRWRAFRVLLLLLGCCRHTPNHSEYSDIDENYIEKKSTSEWVCLSYFMDFYALAFYACGSSCQTVFISMKVFQTFKCTHFSPFHAANVSLWGAENFPFDKGSSERVESRHSFSVRVTIVYIFHSIRCRWISLVHETKKKCQIKRWNILMMDHFSINKIVFHDWYRAHLKVTGVMPQRGKWCRSRN